MSSSQLDASLDASGTSLSDPVELQHVEQRIARRRSTLPDMILPEVSGGIPVSKNSSFVEANVVADPQRWNHRFTGVFTDQVSKERSKEKLVTPAEPNVDKPQTPEIKCCSLFFS
ncbi:hypothetical protein TraAM80_05473 [Trypanosoma rangeli]|uniref:Uncharacterized protein n=1 Tax=Trypanosoma rangeli TaxID=5698 RepID=A0A422NEY0_TRYRA|nr:uncharacterized protein TraAM80_05473 [Trypanosoma rangeli]RNF04023.1 hypothetical protein TraAM80_05473 [Trypanosoma rangeli]|eukprot:RNF04023.1 hypothetical protein TraAM80_05473 [Trypanosoma rangeli]